MSVRVEQLSHTYASPNLAARTVLTIAQWSLPAGSQVLLRGISGSGKTTLMNILAGLLRPTSGVVYVGEQDLYALREAERDRFRAQNIGYVFQNHLLASNLSALENVIMPMAFAHRIAAGQRRGRASHLLADVGLADFVRHRPAQLSAGQRLRVAVARALANGPRLLLADEPTAALDAASGAVVMDLLQATARATDTVLLVASHDPALNDRFPWRCDLRDGRLTADD